MARLLGRSSIRRSLFRNLQESRESFLETQVQQLCSFSTKGRKKSKSPSSDSGEENMSKKDLSLKLAMDQIQASFGQESLMWLGRQSSSSEKAPVISTGSFALDIALGIGGFPKGRVVEIYGPEASGKTTISLHVIAEAQKQGGYCAFVDAEHSLDPALAESIGVNTKNLLVSQPDCGEQALSLVDTLIRSGSLDVIVVAALVPKGELDGEMGDAHMAMQARLMSQALRKLTHSLSLSQTILIFTNQVRATISTFGGFGGPSEVTCGGNALKFYASLRLNVRRIGQVKKGEEVIGNRVMVKIMKNKHAPPYKTAEFELEFGKGISREVELIVLGCKYKFIRQAASFFYMNDQTFRGKDALKNFLAENTSARLELEKKIKDKLVSAVDETATPSESIDQEAVEATA
ncbi:DNA repair protein recA homolog 3, mitochondrial-like isoform X2 [Andrographis paniculata]|uniref:DNA repair protein recA homolog 3, mitochondrial-like isoform X2 n=1 Tax=Andrographis paniculata TaxID=175694 RepID=UPI0021E8C33E|nr:DNA repair protein recA homolog 3, mitochondrial-like isoform X2 [Andrographis paniculata]